MTTDGWTSRAITSYISLTIHYLNKDFDNECVSLGVMHLPGSHTADNIANFIVVTLEKLHLVDVLKNKTIFWVTDNAANMKIAIDSQRNWVRIPCFAPTLQLAVNDCKTEDEITQVIKK